jgi:predicted transcriptional regulator YheO
LSKVLDLDHFFLLMLLGKKQSKNLTAAERVQAMLVQAVGENGGFHHGALKKIRDHFGCSRVTIWRLGKALSRLVLMG